MSILAGFQAKAADVLAALATKVNSTNPTFSGSIQTTLLINAASDAAAATAGVVVGQLYRNGSFVMQRVV
jgi:hypothetical protein